MKTFQYLLFSALLFLCACSNTPEENTIPGTNADREALLATSQYGVYHNGTAVLTFDKTKYQLYANPSKHIYRILDNAGINYVELRLDAAPSANASVNATQSNNLSLDLPALGEMLQLKSDDKRLWLWSDQARVGFIVPKGGI